MKPRVAIGITTYKPILDADFGKLLFEAYEAVSSRIVPYQVAVDSERYPVNSAKDFAAHWHTAIPVEILDRKGGNIVDRYVSHRGAEWRTKGVFSGGGQVLFTPDTDPRGSHTVTLEHNFSESLDWVKLFRSLVSIFSPSYAMLHIFTERELSMIDERQRFAFNGPIAHETHFTSWLSSSGDWRRPDSFRFEERRHYRFLSELSWANVFGPEFSGRYNAVSLAQQASLFEKVGETVYLQVTDQLRDIVDAPFEFERARARLKASFVNDVFRTP
ncbi:hypothetical protein SAMN05518849_101713 [Sphingobium sp. AP50]|uniref:hypothetical protein n=1 Tax=Sphingobium sp. AP50 TaxID=1884369 RepID=UPI0008C0CF0C|nr:hypothetical protein [Sphingobium sp. AP50]SEI73183.1 hypothetical protein SAMN05518849_101713 [Sphingobium sp. AP50]